MGGKFKRSFYLTRYPPIKKAAGLHRICLAVGILNLAGDCVTLLERHFPNSIDRIAEKDSGPRPGPPEWLAWKWFVTVFINQT